MHWDDWFVHILVSKLDAKTRMHWETSLANFRDFPTFKQLQDFLENRVRALEAANLEVAQNPAGPSIKANKSTRVAPPPPSPRPTRSRSARCATGGTI